MANILLPLGVNFKTWSDQVRQDLPDITFPIANHENEWRGWAAQVINQNELYDVPAPTELAYPNDDNWKNWASYFVDSVLNIISK